MTDEETETGADEAPDRSEEPEETTAPEAGREPGPGRARTSSALVGGLVLAVALLGIAAGLAVVQWQRAGDLEDERDDRRQIADVAGRFGEAFLSYDFEDVEGSGAAVLALATESFARDFQETQVPGLQELFENIQSSTVARTTGVFVGDVGAGTATALVVVDVSSENNASGRQTLTDLLFQLALLEVDGEWLVDEVLPPPSPAIEGADEEGGDPGATSSTTATTAPTDETPTTAPPEG